MNRSALLTALIDRYGGILAEAGITADEAGIGAALNDTEAALAATGADTDQWAEPFARYYLLDRIVDALTTQINIVESGSTFTLNQLMTNTERRLKEARAVVAWYVVPSPPTDTTVPVPDGSYANGGRIITWRAGR